MNLPARIAVIGDLHGHWDDWDTRYFDASDYALLLFTGDLGSGSRDNGVRTARAIARLTKPALVMPGNNDVQVAPQIAAEMGHQYGLRALMQFGATRPTGEPYAPAGRVQLCGYSAHPIALGDREVTLIAARPYAMGGGALSFPEQLAASYGVHDMDESVARLRALVEQTMTRDVIVLAHNGPHGLGADPDDLWGCDFAPERGDFGDHDLAELLRHARALDKRVLAVIAGHMHSPTRAGAARKTQVRRDGTLYLNPARVPRIYGAADGVRRHHVMLELDRGVVAAHEIIAREL